MWATLLAGVVVVVVCMVKMLVVLGYSTSHRKHKDLHNSKQASGGGVYIGM